MKKDVSDSRSLSADGRHCGVCRCNSAERLRRNAYPGEGGPDVGVCRREPDADG